MKFQFQAAYFTNFPVVIASKPSVMVDVPLFLLDQQGSPNLSVSNPNQTSLDAVRIYQSENFSVYSKFLLLVGEVTCLLYLFASAIWKLGNSVTESLCFSTKIRSIEATNLTSPKSEQYISTRHYICWSKWQFREEHKFSFCIVLWSLFCYLNQRKWDIKFHGFVTTTLCINFVLICKII